MKSTFFTILFLFIAYSPTFSQNNPLTGFDELVKEVMTDWQVPGMGIGIVKDGKVILAKGYGFRDMAKKLPVDKNTLFAIGSCTKAFTAAGVAQAVDDRQLDFDKPVISYFPSFKMYDDYTTQHITFRDMLSHRSGLPRHDFAWYGANKSREDLFNALQYLEPNADFRTTWQYQNIMFMTAGYLIGQQYNQTWEEFIENHIFEPLDMNNSNFSIKTSQKSDNHALPYQLTDEKVEEMDFRNIDAIGPAGSINSTINDMNNWLMMHLNKGQFKDKIIISEGNFQQMHQPQMIMPGAMSDEIYYRSYGMGWMLTSYRGNFRSEHGGNIDGFSANVGFLPRAGIGVVILTNMNGTSAPSIIRNSIFDRLLGIERIDWNKKLKDGRDKSKKVAKELDNDNDPLRKNNTVPSHPIVDYVGDFEHPAYGKIEIKAVDNNLIMDIRGKEIELEHYHYDIYRVKSASIFKGKKFTFHSSKNGDINKISASLQAGVKDIIFERVANINNVDYNLYIGDFELAGQATRFYVENGVLKLSVPPQPVYELELKNDHSFSIKGAEGFLIVFDIKNGKPAQSVIFNQPNGTFTAKRKQ